MIEVLAWFLIIVVPVGAIVISVAVGVIVHRVSTKVIDSTTNIRAIANRRRYW